MDVKNLDIKTLHELNAGEIYSGPLTRAQKRKITSILIKKEEAATKRQRIDRLNAELGFDNPNEKKLIKDLTKIREMTADEVSMRQAGAYDDMPLSMWVAMWK